MNKMMIMISTLILLTSTAMANSSDKLSDTSEAVSTALVAFQNDSTAETIGLFKGIKAAPKANGVSVKIYLADGTKQAYACHKHDDSDPFECHQSN